MPFRAISETNAGGLEAWPANLPRPLVVAILDGPSEREGRTTAIITQGFIYEHPASGAEIEAPEGYITDFASIPALARGLFPPFGRHAKAAVLHDWLYQVGEPGMKPFADRVFLDAMTDLGVSAARRNTMYTAVRLGGGGGYGRAQATWDSGFGDWRTGDPAPAPCRREERYSAHWPRPPRPGYTP